MSVTLIGILLAIVLVGVTDIDKSSMLTRGDFPGFYGPAWMVWNGLGSELYNFNVQGQIQNRFWPSFGGAFYISVYPPHLAILISPLAALSDQSAKLVATLTMLFCAMGAVLTTIKLRSPPPTTPLMWLGICFTFAPLTVAVLSAQNTGLTMLLLALATKAALHGGKRGARWAGLWLGLLLYKPQFSIVATAFMSVVLGGAVLTSWSLVAVVAYGIAVPFLGWDWPLNWFEAGRRFGAINQQINDHNFVSVEALSQLILSPFGVPIEAIRVLGWGITLALVLAITTRLYTLRSCQDQNTRRYGFALLLSSLPLIFPQTLFYDLGITLLAALLVLFLDSTRPHTDQKGWWLVGLLALTAVVTMVRDLIQLPLLALVSLVVLVMAWRHSTPPPKEGSL
jgi:hypothetical protein